MSKTTKLRARALRLRPEVARLRAAGGLTPQVLVDGASLGVWSARVGADVQAVLEVLREAADVGRRQLVLVVSARLAPASWPAPHAQVLSAPGIAGLLRGHAFGDVDLPALPSVVVAGVEHDRQLLDCLEAGATSVLDIATGRLWTGSQREHYDADFAAAAGNAAVDQAPAASRALAAMVTASPAALRTGRVHVVSALHREEGHVVLDSVTVDDGARHRADGHVAGLRLLRGVLARGALPVMTSSMDVLDALYDAGEPLPFRVEDPALACAVLDPDLRSLPPGVGSAWHAVLSGRRSERPVKPAADLLLDELPTLHDELRDALRAASLLPLYEEDVCATAPLFAALESEGFRVDKAGLSTDLAAVEAEMVLARAVVLKGVGDHALRNADLVGGSRVHIGQLIRMADSSLPSAWRNEDQLLERYALYRNPRAMAVLRLRALDAVYSWMKKLEGLDRLRSTLDPSATGRWYPHGEALFTISKRESEAMRLRAHLVPEPGHVLVAGDFAAFEPRLLAHQSGDTTLVAGCQPGRDIYTHLMPLLGVTDRDIAKQALLAFMYGRSARSFAVSLPLPLPEGHAVFNKLESQLTGSLAFRKSVQESDTTSARSLLGWRRLRSTQSPAKFARQAFNLRMQGSAADLLRKLLRDLHAALPASVRVVHQEFDAVILTCPAPQAVAVEALLKNTMENVAKLTVPLVAKTKHGATLAAVS